MDSITNNCTLQISGGIEVWRCNQERNLKDLNHWTVFSTSLFQASLLLAIFRFTLIRRGCIRFRFRFRFTIPESTPNKRKKSDLSWIKRSGGRCLDSNQDLAMGPLRLYTLQEATSWQTDWPATRWPIRRAILEFSLYQLLVMLISNIVRLIVDITFLRHVNGRLAPSFDHARQNIVPDRKENRNKTC
jgi:hypothetical protein